MGLEIELQAIPDGCELIARAVSGTAYGGDGMSFGELLGCLPSFFHNGKPTLPDYKRFPTEVEFWEMAKRLLQKHPGLDRRNVYLSSWYDTLLYVLSADYRGDPATPNDHLWKKAVYGDRVLATHISGGQGIPLRYVLPQDVKDIAALLTPLTFADLEPHIDCQRIVARELYKGPHPDESNADVARFLSEIFCVFRSFYLEAAANGEGVLVKRD